jgi:hypothetical protein
MLLLHQRGHNAEGAHQSQKGNPPFAELVHFHPDPADQNLKNGSGSFLE